MVNNKQIIEKVLNDNISKNGQKQYNRYKTKVAELQDQYNKIKQKRGEIAAILKQMRKDNILDSHFSKLLVLIKNQSFKRRKTLNDKNIEKINSYFEEIQQITVESLKIIFEIRKFFTDQEFDIFLEEEGKVFSFSIEDIEKHSGNVIPIYTDSLDKFIENLNNNSKTVSAELNKLGLTLKKINKDFELEGIQSYLDLVEKQVKRDKIKISENRKLEAAIYLYERKNNINFNSKTDRQSLHSMLGWYVKQGGLRDNITMYKLGDAVRETESGFKNIEIKMHNGTISLSMVANGIKRLNNAFSSVEAEEKFVKFFGVNKNRLSSPIERAAAQRTERAIRERFKQLKIGQK